MDQTSSKTFPALLVAELLLCIQICNSVTADGRQVNSRGSEDGVISKNVWIVLDYIPGPDGKLKTR